MLLSVGIFVVALAAIGVCAKDVMVEPQVEPYLPHCKRHQKYHQYHRQPEMTEKHAKYRNGVETTKGTTEIVDLALDSGWFKFFFGGAGNFTAYTFRFNLTDYEYVLISITDAFCVGDSFDLYRNGDYLLTTPRVPSDNCRTWNVDPDVTFWNPRWSNTKFMLPGPFNLTVRTKDSPFNGGAAFIRAESRIVSCPNAVAPFILINEPLVPKERAAAVCARVNAVPAHITPANAAAAAQSLRNCGDHKHAWFGRLSLVQSKLRQQELGCLAFDSTVPDDPTVDVLDCKTRLPVLCLPA